MRRETGQRILFPLVLWICFSPFHSLQAETLVLTDTTEVVPLGPYVEYYEDLTGAMTIADVIRQARWGRSENKSLAFGVRDSAFWFKVKVDQQSKQDWVIEWTYPLLDYVDLYVPDATDRFKRIETGRLRPFAS